MILEEAQKILSNNYKILSLIDLTSIDCTSQKNIYDLLLPLQKKEFNNNERIVFYCFSPLHHKFNDLPADVLIQLQKMLVYVDIPNFFCIILTNIKELQSELDYICNNFAVKETPIKTIICEDSTCLE